MSWTIMHGAKHCRCIAEKNKINKKNLEDFNHVTADFMFIIVCLCDTGIPKLFKIFILVLLRFNVNI